MNVILKGIVGSTAYGLATPESDVDRLGMYAAPTVEFHGLHPPVGKSATMVTLNPDITMHEVGKFVSLALGGNPTVMELLWLEEYEEKTYLGDEIINIRQAFLSAPRVRNAYLGYATQQFRLLERRGDGSFGSDLRKRTAKHARHLLRLCHQGFTLYATGVLEIKLEYPEQFRKFGERVAEGDLTAAQDMMASYEKKFDETESILPDHPDEEKVEAWLRRVRLAYL